MAQSIEPRETGKPRLRFAIAVAAAGALAALAACQSHTALVMEDPISGQRVECRVNPINGDEKVQAEACALAWERRGFVRAPQ
jgi:hypothetical protein